MNQTSKVNALIEEHFQKLSKILAENHPYILRVILVCHQSPARLYRNSAFERGTWSCSSCSHLSATNLIGKRKPIIRS